MAGRSQIWRPGETRWVGWAERQALQVQGELTSIVAIVLAALACGVIAVRLKLPSIIGYIFAGILLGPSGLALVHDRGDIGVVAELGVLLLLYTIGMQLSLRGFRAAWKVASGTAALQVAGLTSLREGQKVSFELVSGRNGKAAAENLTVED